MLGNKPHGLLPKTMAGWTTTHIGYRMAGIYRNHSRKRCHVTAMTRQTRRTARRSYVTNDPFTNHHDEFVDGMESTLQCEGCQTAKHLMIESIGPIQPIVVGRVAVEYSCGQCGSFFGHDATVQQVAKLLNATATAPGILHFGRYFIHCGEPMEELGGSVSHLHPPVGGHTGSPDRVSLRTRRLKCQCGFQLEVPL